MTHSKHRASRAAVAIAALHELMMSGDPGMARMHERMHEPPDESQP